MYVLIFPARNNLLGVEMGEAGAGDGNPKGGKGGLWYPPSDLL